MEKLVVVLGVEVLWRLPEMPETLWRLRELARVSLPALDFSRAADGEREIDGASRGNGLGALYFSRTGMISSSTTQLWLPPANIL